MPVDGGGFREVVGDQDADPVSFDSFNGRPWRASVVSPAIEDDPFYKFLFHRLCDEVEHFDPIVHGEGKGRDVRCFNGRVAPHLCSEQEKEWDEPSSHSDTAW